MLNNFYDNITHVFTAYGIKATVAGLVVCTGININFFTIFAILLLIDTFTKWLALAYEFDGKRNLWRALCAIPAAHRAHVIDSHAMRIGFFTKMLTYLILIAAGALTDKLFTMANGSPLFVHLVVTYLSATEFLSIAENLDAAGVSMISGLINAVKIRVKK